MKAFTLFEVLVALGIFALAVMGLMMALDSALSAAREIRISSLVRSQIANKLALLEGGPIKRLERVSNTASPPVKYTESVQPEQVIGRTKEILNGFWKVRVMAEWEEGGQPQKEEASFLRYGSATP